MSTSLLSVLLLGLFAGGVSCAAVQGGLLAGLVTRHRAAHPPGGRSRPPSGRPGSRGTGEVLGDDLAPVGAFLAGKLVSHALLGALLGAVGSLIQLSLQVRAMAQLAAGVLIIVMGLAQLGVKGFRGLAITPPASWGRLVRGRARSISAFAPAVLGVSSVLIPCGVTLSVMALAVTSGSPLRGAAVMAVFVAGTAPLFTVLGYVAARARRAAGPWSRRLAVATGVLVLALGAYTLNGGLELTGSPLSASNIGAAIGLGDHPRPAPSTADGENPVTVADGRQTVIVTAVTDAYRPANLEIQAGLPTTLVVRARDAQGCVRAFVVPSRGIQKVLPRDGDTSMDLGTLKPGTLRYSCGMGMYTGRLTIVEKS